MDSKINPNYLMGLNRMDKKEQSELIKKSMEEYRTTGRVSDRPKVSDDQTPRSSYVKEFESRYGFPITNLKLVQATFPDAEVKTILSKGYAAYGSSGSRPNVSKEQWAYARLASVLTGGPALRIDASLVGPTSLRKIRGPKAL